MKRLFYAIIILSIFGTSYICKAQTGEYSVQLCNLPTGNIAITQLQNIASGSCDMIKFYDADGNEMKLKEFEMGAVVKNKKNNFWIKETSGKLTPKHKELIGKLSVGDEFLVQNVVLEDGKNLLKPEAVYKFKIVK